MTELEYMQSLKIQKVIKYIELKIQNWNTELKAVPIIYDQSRKLPIDILDKKWKMNTCFLVIKVQVDLRN